MEVDSENHRREDDEEGVCERKNEAKTRGLECGKGGRKQGS